MTGTELTEDQKKALNTKLLQDQTRDKERIALTKYKDGKNFKKLEKEMKAKTDKLKKEIYEGTYPDVKIDPMQRICYSAQDLNKLHIICFEAIIKLIEGKDLGAELLKKGFQDNIEALKHNILMPIDTSLGQGMEMPSDFLKYSELDFKRYKYTIYNNNALRLEQMINNRGENKAEVPDTDVYDTRDNQDTPGEIEMEGIQ